MRTIASFMDKGIKNGFVKNDALIAVKCEVTQATVSRWRSGDRIPEDEEILVLAETLGEDPWEMLAVARYHKAKNNETKEAWEGIARKIVTRMAGATMAGLLIFTVLPQRAEAAGNQLTSCRLLFSEIKRMASRRLSQALLRLLVLITTRPAHAQS